MSARTRAHARLTLRRTLQVVALLGVPLGAAWFCYTAGGRYGEIHLWRMYLARDEEPKAGVLIVVASLVLLAVSTLRRREPTG